MQEKLQSWLNKLIEKWTGFERKQQIKIIAIAALVVVALGLTIYFAFRPNMVEAVSDLNYTLAKEMQDKLATEGIYSEISRDGKSLYTEMKDRDQAWIVVSTNEFSSDSGYKFSDALQDISMTSTKTMQEETLNRVLESEFSRIVKQMDGIKDATVKFYLPESSGFFLEDEGKATASVQVQTTRTLSSAEGEAIAMLLSRGISKLSMEDIVVLDTNYNILYSSDNQGVGGLSKKADAEAQMNTIIEGKVKFGLTPIFPDVRVVPNLQFDWDEYEESTRKYEVPNGDTDATMGYVDKSSTMNKSGTTGTPQAEPGYNGNNNQTPGYDTQNGSSSSVTEKSNDTQYLYNIIESAKRGEVGKLVKADSSMAVLAYRYKTYDEAQMQKEGKLKDTSWGAFKDTIPERTLIAADDYKDILAALQIGTGIQNFTMVAYELPIFVEAEVQPLDIGLIVMFVLLFLFIIMLAYGLIKRTQPDEITEIEPELSVEDLLVSTQLEEEKEMDIAKLADIHFSEDSEVKKQIDKFVVDKPEAVAQLLRNWINEDWE